jgi:hypothetical protein
MVTHFLIAFAWLAGNEFGHTKYTGTVSSSCPFDHVHKSCAVAMLNEWNMILALSLCNV